MQQIPPIQIQTFKSESEQRIINRNHTLYWAIWDHCEKNRRTWRDEYNLVLEKKSELTRSQREYLVNVIELKR